MDKIIDVIKEKAENYGLTVKHQDEESSLILKDKDNIYHSIIVRNNEIYYEVLYRIKEHKNKKSQAEIVNSLNIMEPIGKYYITEEEGYKYLAYSECYIVRTDNVEEEVSLLLNYAKNAITNAKKVILPS